MGHAPGWGWMMSFRTPMPMPGLMCLPSVAGFRTASLANANVASRKRPGSCRSDAPGRERVRSTRSREPRKTCRCCHGYSPTNANRT